MPSWRGTGALFHIKQTCMPFSDKMVAAVSEHGGVNYMSLFPFHLDVSEKKPRRTTEKCHCISESRNLESHILEARSFCDAGLFQACIVQDVLPHCVKSRIIEEICLWKARRFSHKHTERKRKRNSASFGTIRFSTFSTISPLNFPIPP